MKDPGSPSLQGLLSASLADDSRHKPTYISKSTAHDDLTTGNFAGRRAILLCTACSTNRVGTTFHDDIVRVYGQAKLLWIQCRVSSPTSRPVMVRPPSRETSRCNPSTAFAIASRSGHRPTPSSMSTAACTSELPPRDLRVHRGYKDREGQAGHDTPSQDQAAWHY